MLMRITITLLMAALLVFGIVSWADYDFWLMGPSPSHYTWWWPEEMSTLGQHADNLFWLIMVMVTVMFVITMGALTYSIWKFSAKRQDKAVFSHGSHKLELLWTAIPAALLLVIAFSQMSTFAAMQFDSSMEDENGEELPVLCEIWASQFDWRFRYPGRDGRFGTNDDFESAYELVMPMRDTFGDPDDKKVVFLLRSRDVLHSFFVPHLRFKRDAVPGMTQRIWLGVDDEQLAEIMADREDKSFDIICAELCGWGHYKMSGRVRVLPDAEYEKWVDEMTALQFGNS